METAASSQDFTGAEWHRLSAIAHRHEPSMRLAYTKAVQSRRQVDTLALRNAITTLLVEVCDTTAPVYGMVFNPNSERYLFTIDRLVEKFTRGINLRESRQAVSDILPANLGMSERAARLDTFGLDSRSATRLERMRQEGSSELEIDRERNRSIALRGNIIATTETNRIVNQSLIALWRDNAENELISKARRRAVEYRGMSRRGVMQGPHKTWTTRRDDKVCTYCDPLDGITARLDAEFDTRYGVFDSPPIHPNCRCFMVLG
jgi:hypothetical protein